MQEQQSIPAGKKDKQKWLLVVILLVFLLAAAAAGVWFFGHTAAEDTAKEDPIGYESTAVVLTDENAAKNLAGSVEDGSMALRYKHIANSTDGQHFSCYLMNPEDNAYDMYMGIYLDEGLTDEVLLTKLIPPGSGLETFETSRVLEPGTYETVLVFTTVGDDHQAIVNQVCVAYTLTVQ